MSATERALLFFLFSEVSPRGLQSLYSMQTFLGNCVSGMLRELRTWHQESRVDQSLRPGRSEIKRTRMGKKKRYLRIGAVNCTEIQRGEKSVCFDINRSLLQPILFLKNL